MDNNDKLRPLYLAKILYEQTDENHFLTTTDLIQILEQKYGITSHRVTIKNDIELLINYGLDIQEIKSTQNRYNLVNRLFDIPELKLLIDAVESAKFITKKKSSELVDKIGKLAGEYSGDDLKRNLSVEGRIKSGNEKIYIIIDTINEAINKSKKISFVYFQYDEHKNKKLKRNGEPFIFSPLHLVWNGDYYYVVGLFEEKQKIGSFRVDRIAKCPVILDEMAVPVPKDSSISEYLNTTFRMYDGEHCQVELVCDNKVVDSIIDRFGKNIELVDNDNDTFKIIVNVAVSHVFYSWVFGFQGLVKIDSPQYIKEQYEEMVKHACECLTQE